MGDNSETTGDEQKRANLFKPGQSGNPKGRPKGSRNKLGEQFISDLQADWEANGAKAIATVRADRPSDYLKVVASILPKEHIVRQPTEEMTDDELADRLAILEELIAFAGANGSGPQPTHEGSGTKGKPQ